MRLAMLTTGRQDWSLLCSLAQALEAAPDFELILWAGGMHAREGAMPAALDGLRVQGQVECLPSSDDGAGVAWAAGTATQQVARLLEATRPDGLILAGDRTETLGAAVGATCARVPIIHLHGGEETEGAVDNACRHAITKLSHVHCVAHTSFAARVLRMGEAPSRVFVTGAPGLDLARHATPLPREELATRFGLPNTAAPWLLCTHHPTTLGAVPPAVEFEQVLQGVEEAARKLDAAVLFTRPNLDDGGAVLNAMLDGFVASHGNARAVSSMGGPAYLSMLRHAACMVGNSSSGIIEAPLFQLPVVNVGTRQQGRLQGSNVLNVPATQGAVSAAILQACSPAFRAGLQGTTSPYGDGHACTRILDALRRTGASLPQLAKAFAGNIP